MGVVLLENGYSGVLLIFPLGYFIWLADAVAKMDASAKGYTAKGLWLETGKVNFQNSTFRIFSIFKGGFVDQYKSPFL